MVSASLRCRLGRLDHQCPPLVGAQTYRSQTRAWRRTKPRAAVRRQSRPSPALRHNRPQTTVAGNRRPGQGRLPCRKGTMRNFEIFRDSREKVIAGLKRGHFGRFRRDRDSYLLPCSTAGDGRESPLKYTQFEIVKHVTGTGRCNRCLAWKPFRKSCHHPTRPITLSTKFAGRAA